jgi:hypothetical protein
LDVAARLQTVGDEASYRAAISRAYYAACGTAAQRLDADIIPWAQMKAGWHQRLWTTYGQQSDAPRQQIAVDGRRLKKRRVAADYKLHMQNPHREAQRALRDARKLVSNIDAL